VRKGHVPRGRRAVLSAAQLKPADRPDVLRVGIERCPGAWLRRRSAMKLRYVLVLATVLAAVGTFAGPAEANRWVNCCWDGSRPICAGRCRPGFTQLRREGSGCITGARVYCCVSAPKNGTAHDQCRQGARMGDPGCPYPRFGLLDQLVSRSLFGESRSEVARYLIIAAIDELVGKGRLSEDGKA
jgi:hypothetical protein